MSTESVASSEDRTSLLNRRLDELDRLLLGLLPRGERLALVASVEARVHALGGEVELAPELPTQLPATALTIAAGRRARRSRLAYSSGVLGIVAAACLVASPLLFLGLSIFGELLGEAFAMILLGLIALLVTCGGGLAVFGGGVSLLRLARRDQTATGTGWAITGLCTGALPLLLGLVGMLSLAPGLISTEVEYVSRTVEPVGYPSAATTAYGTPVPMNVDGRCLPMPVAPLPAQPMLEPAGWREPKPEVAKAEPKPSELLPAASAAPAAEPVEIED